MKRWRLGAVSASLLGLAAAALLILASFSAAELLAQAPQIPRGGLKVAQRRAPVRPANVDRNDDESTLDGVFLPPDRTAKRRLEMAQQLLEERRFGEAVRLLGALLESSEDFFFKPNAEEPVYHSLKAQAGRLIARLPAEGRESYELQFGARARGMLKQAASAGNFDDVVEVSRRFFYTDAGMEATFLVGRHHLDQDRPLAAALCLERLHEIPAARERLEPGLSMTLAACWLRAGKSERAKETLVRLKRARGGSEVVIAGKTVPLFGGDAQAFAWMDEKFGKQPALRSAEAEQWTMFRGDQSRNAASTGGQPLLNVRWRQRTADDSTVEKFVGKVRHDYLNQDVVAMPSFHPLAVGDAVIMRTTFALQAVDFNSGKLIWKYPSTDDSLEQFLRAGGAQPQTPGAQQMFAGLNQRLWDDAIYGTLSSDAQQVYYVEDLGLAGVMTSVRYTVMPNGHRTQSVAVRGTNRLAARELRTQGKLKWEVGGLTGEDEPKLAGAFFLSPPLPLLGHLYVLAEMKGQEIRLMVLSPKTGALEWSQQLSVVEQPGVQLDSARRNAGAAPSFADGVLVCPTSAGAIVAIDLTTRSLLWGYQYPRPQQPQFERFGINRPLGMGADRQSNEHWIDGSVTIADGRVLVAPVETDQLYCLNLADGRELWKESRANGNSLYVACVHQGNVILVGRGSISALQLSDGEKTWTDVELPAGSIPSGRGFYAGEDYYLPLTTAEVAKINLRTGRIEARAKSRSGSVPGNLICYRGSVLSQGVDNLDAFFQIDALKAQVADALKAHPDDPQALASLGEVKLDEGRLAEAVDLFRRSYSLQQDEATRGRLVESLLESLRVDFVANRANLDELDKLIEDPKHRLTFWRLKAVGLQNAGEVMPAFETYLKLVDVDTPLGFDAIDERLTVRRDRWIGTQLQALRSVASAQQQSEIDAVVADRLAAAAAAGTPEALRSFLNVFGAHPVAERAREDLVAKLGADDLLERNLLLQRLERSTDVGEAGRAAAEMARALVETNHLDLAAIYYRELAGRFAKTVCRDGKTGEQLVAELAADSPITKRLAVDRRWPEGSTMVRDDKAPGRTAGATLRAQRTVDLDIIGPRGPLFQNVTLAYDNQQNVIAEDGLGERRFRIALNEQGARRITANVNAYNNPLPNYLAVNGGLLVVARGNQLAALDTLGGADPSASRVLWTQELNDQIGGLASNPAIIVRPTNLPWGGTRSVPEDTNGRRLGTIGPVNDDGVYFQRLHDLHCVDPLSGKPIWTRKNVGLGNDLFGDEELLFVAPAAEGETLVLRAATGELLDKRHIAPFNKRVTTVGRRVLTWDQQENDVVLNMRDVWLDQTVWSHHLAQGSKVYLVGQDVLGAFQPDGQFWLLSLADGKPLVNERLEPETGLLGIYLLRSNDGYLLVTSAAARNEANANIHPVHNAGNSPVVSGRVYAFTNEGKKRWPAPAVIAQQGLLLNQPAEVPLLVFIRQVHRASPNSSNPKVSILCLDKRTGQVVYENEQLPSASVANFEINGDPVAHTVSLTLGTKLITISFSDPVEDDPKAAAPPRQGQRSLKTSQFRFAEPKTKSS